ncbi:MAG: hypothetical protein JO117_02355 [Verrucomicrobia bacterium]|nr:hypothetical protein [Verrucomicrobiota bacterium]MBV9658486.1 hypothetical protein [Verrucomicrobiota bacterium]
MHQPSLSPAAIWTKAFCGLLGLALIFCGPARVRADDPAPVDTEYFHSVGGVFTYDERDGIARNWVVLTPRKLGPGNGALYLEIFYENPQRGAAPLIERRTVRPADKRKPIVLRSPPLTGLRTGRNYTTTVKIYADAAHTNSLGTHVQATANHIPQELLDHPRPAAAGSRRPSQ